MKFKIGDKVKVAANNLSPDQSWIGKQGVICHIYEDIAMPYGVLLDNGNEYTFQESELGFLDEEISDQTPLLTYILEPIKEFTYEQLHDAVMFLKRHDEVGIAVGEMLERAVEERLI